MWITTTNKKRSSKFIYVAPIGWMVSSNETIYLNLLYTTPYIKRARAAVDEETVNPFFDNLEKAVEEIDDHFF